MAFESWIDTKEIISKDPLLLSLLKKAERAALCQVPVLIEGPSGTGKELLARKIHMCSKRAHKPWVAINCAALPSGLLESELFGYERGAFTGAVERKSGKFEQAHGGTLLLDEIGELDLLLQAKLLRVLQEGELDRLGSTKPVKIDVRVIATTNRNLEELVRDGKFRSDLFYRLYGMRFKLPAVRNRMGDISLLAHEFLRRQEILQGRHFEFSHDVIPALQAREWPGNVRELSMSIERAAVLSESGFIELKHFEFSDYFELSLRSSFSKSLNSAALDAKPMREREKEIILESLQNFQGNRTHAAKSLGMSLRTLRHKLKQYREEGSEIPENIKQSFSKNKDQGQELER